MLTNTLIKAGTCHILTVLLHTSWLLCCAAFLVATFTLRKRSNILMMHVAKRCSNLPLFSGATKLQSPVTAGFSKYEVNTAKPNVNT